MLAIEKDGNETASILIENGANVELKDKEGKSAIFYAINRNSPYLLSILLQGGADINVCDSTGTLPLMYALALRNEHIKEILIELTTDAGGDTNSTNQGHLGC